MPSVRVGQRRERKPTGGAAPISTAFVQQRLSGLRKTCGVRRIACRMLPLAWRAPALLSVRCRSTSSPSTAQRNIGSVVPKRFVISLAVLLIGACQTTEDAGGVMRDSLGNVYPEKCRGPMICKADYDCQIGSARVLVQYYPREKMRDGLLGTHSWGVVSIAQGLPQKLHDDVLRHEICHAIAGSWHK